MGMAKDCVGRSGGVEAAVGDRCSPGSAAGAWPGNSNWWPPGFRFHPTDEEIVLYYLKRKICGRRFRLAMIGDVDVYKWEPWELPDKSELKSGDKQWYFFSPRDRKYPNGSRSNRATKCGYWKTTGKDRTISQNSKAMGNKKTLVYYHGRAPKGERTNWVMHEYTLDEQVFLSCNNVQDCYALYKVFRKSGPGPKNGEQYGAPFREEEWDDDVVDEIFRSQDNSELPTNPWNTEVPTIEPLHDLVSAGTSCDAGSNQLVDELEDILLELSNEQNMVGQYSEHSAYVSEVNVETEIGTHNFCPSLTKATSFENSGICYELSTSDTKFQVTQPDSACVQPVEDPEMTSLTSNTQQILEQADEEFLEIKDFNDPESIMWSWNDLNNRDQIDGPNELYDSYDYFDAPVAFSDDFDSLGLAAPISYLDGFGGDEALDESYHVSTELWGHNQGFGASNADPNQVFMISPASGAAYASTSSNMEMVQQQNSTSESWFSSALSTLLDSVPSRPALASENTFISRAFERVSSFRAGQVGVHGPNATADGHHATSGRRGGRNGGILFISFLVGLGAVFWVLTAGAVVKVFSAFLARFNSS
ncbi:unnamed protein product [Musa banksii]